VPLAQSGKESEEMALVLWDELLPIVSPYQERREGAGVFPYRLAFEQWPPDVAEFLGRPRTKIENLNGIGMDQILDRELVEQGSHS